MITKVCGNLWRGPRIETIIDHNVIRNLKVNCIINLEEVDEVSILDDKRFCKCIESDFRNLPMSEFKRPDSQWLRYVVATINADLHRKTVYIHCKHGQDRTGFVIAAYRMLIQGWSFDKAYRECLDMGHKAWFYDYFPLYWKKSLKELLKGGSR